MGFLEIYKILKINFQFIENFLNNLLLINSIILERKIDPSSLLILFRMLFNDGQLKCLEEKPDNSNVFNNFCDLIFKVFFKIECI